MKKSQPKQIRNRILKMEMVAWRNLKWFQQKGLKEMKEDAFKKLKTSLINNNFSDPFKVWQDGEEIWILDGHHREKAMKELESEGVNIPDLLPANFIECRDRKEAAKLVLVYSSIYANVTEDGLREFMDLEKLDFGELSKEIDLPDVDISGGLPEDWDKDIPEKEETIRPYHKTHVLISFPPGALPKIEKHLKQILKIKEVEYEQSSN